MKAGSSGAIGEQPFEVASEIVRQLRQAKVRYGVFKNIEGLGASLAGKGDLDLLVASDDLPLFRTIVSELHALRGVNRLSGSGPGHEDWFVPDFERAGYLHLDIRSEFSPGRGFADRGLRYEDVTSWRKAPSPFPPIPIVPPEEEARIAQRRAARHGSPLGRLAFSLARRLTRFSPALFVARRRIAPAGVIFALVGPDGVGKSSQVEHVAALFQRKFRCTTVYLGSGEGGWRFRRLVKRWYHQRWSRRRQRSEPSLSGQMRSDLGKKRPLIKMLTHLGAAFERYVTQALARTLARFGAIVISDRWPQNLQPGLFDGPSCAVPHGTPLVRFLASIERALYRKMERHEPDLTIHMLIDFETSRARKPGDREPTDFEERLVLMRRSRARNPKVRVVDARKTEAEVTQDLFRWLWLALWTRAGGTHALEDCGYACPAVERVDLTLEEKPKGVARREDSFASLNSN